MSAPEPLRGYITGQQKADAKVRSVLSGAAQTANTRIAALGNGQLRPAQFDAARTTSESVVKTAMDRVGAVIGSSVKDFEVIGADADYKEIRRQLKDAGISAARADRAIAAMRSSRVVSGTRTAAVRVAFSQIPLAQSVYKTTALTNGLVAKQINIALSRGESAAQLAKRVRGLIDPNTPGGVSYAAMRLARTELNNAFHAGQILAVQDEESVVGMKWNLSGSHPKADACDQYATGNHADLGAGVFGKRDVPRKPHPQCLCYLTPVMEDEDSFLDRLLSGAFGAAS